MGMVPSWESGAPMPPWGLEGQVKRALTRTRDRAVWKGLPNRRNAGGGGLGE